MGSWYELNTGKEWEQQNGRRTQDVRRIPEKESRVAMKLMRTEHTRKYGKLATILVNVLAI